MAGLILLLLGALALLQADDQGAVPDRDVRRVASLLAAPHPQEPRWLRTLFQSMARVEHGPQDLVRRGWAWMAAEGTDSAQANSILYCRRQELALPEVSGSEAADSALERALAL